MGQVLDSWSIPKTNKIPVGAFYLQASISYPSKYVGTLIVVVYLCIPRVLIVVHNLIYSSALYNLMRSAILILIGRGYIHILAGQASSSTFNSVQIFPNSHWPAWPD